MFERQLVYEFERCTEQNRNMAARLQPAASAQFAGLLATRRICPDTSAGAGMRKASTALLEQGTQAPSPAPDLIPAENERQNLTGNSHSDWYSKRGHFMCVNREISLHQLACIFHQGFHLQRG